MKLSASRSRAAIAVLRLLPIFTTPQTSLPQNIPPSLHSATTPVAQSGRDNGSVSDRDRQRRSRIPDRRGIRLSTEGTEGHGNGKPACSDRAQRHVESRCSVDPLHPFRVFRSFRGQIFFLSGLRIRQRRVYRSIFLRLGVSFSVLSGRGQTLARLGGRFHAVASFRSLRTPRKAAKTQKGRRKQIGIICSNGRRSLRGCDLILFLFGYACQSSGF